MLTSARADNEEFNRYGCTYITGAALSKVRQLIRLNAATLGFFASGISSNRCTITYEVTVAN